MENDEGRDREEKRDDGRARSFGRRPRADGRSRQRGRDRDEDSLLSDQKRSGGAHCAASQQDWTTFAEAADVSVRKVSAAAMIVVQPFLRALQKYAGGEAAKTTSK